MCFWRSVIKSQDILFGTFDWFGLVEAHLYCTLFYKLKQSRLRSYQNQTKKKMMQATAKDTLRGKRGEQVIGVYVSDLL